MQARFSQPLLPLHLVEEIQKTYGIAYYLHSEVHWEDGHRHRLQMRNYTHPLSPDFFICDKGDAAFSVEAARPILQFYVVWADIPAVYELLYCGATPDKPDAYGYTPIFIALAELAVRSHLSVARQVLPPSYTPSTAELEPIIVRTCLSAYSRVARILIEQHVDVNQAVNGMSILRLACITKAWDTIALLLEHGAEDTISSHQSTFRSTFPVTGDRDRYTQLVATKQLKPGQNRPARVCPCWSGKTVPECHGKAGVNMAYPLDYVCVCGSGKTYQRCCSRKTFVIEEWDPKLSRIMHRYDHFANDPEMQDEAKKLKEMQRVMEMIQPFATFAREQLGIPEPTLKTHTFHMDPNEFGRQITALGLVDPAFGYAMSRFDEQAPLPINRKTRSRQVSEGTHGRWNALVDEYIALGADTRSVFEIERSAKLGTWGEAYIRQCEGQNCQKVEQRDVDKLQQCVKCQMAVYCGRECQKSAWTTHKKVCSTPPQRPQMVPSQLAIMKALQLPDDLPLGI